MLKKIVESLTLLTLLSLLTNCYQEDSKQTNEQGLQAKVFRKEIKNQLYFQSVIKPISDQALVSPADAIIQAQYFDYGQMVKKGQLLFVLNSNQLQKEYDAALTEYLKAKDILEREQGRFNGSQALWQAGLIAKNNFESDKSSLNNAHINFIQAKANLNDLLKRLGANENFANLTQLKLSDKSHVQAALKKQFNLIKLYACHDGITLLPPKPQKEDIFRQGSFVKKSEVLALIGDLSGLSLAIKVSELEIAKIKPGMKAVVKSIAHPDWSLSGYVHHISAQAINNSSDNSPPVFLAEVVVPNITEEQRLALKVGMSAEVVIVQMLSGSLLVDKSYVFLKEGKPHVIVKKGEQLKLRAIKTGQTDTNHVLVLAGLKEGDIVLPRSSFESHTLR